MYIVNIHPIRTLGNLMISTYSLPRLGRTPEEYWWYIRYYPLKRGEVGGEIPCCPHVRQAAAPPPRHSTSHPGWSAGGAARRS